MTRRAAGLRLDECWSSTHSTLRGFCRGASGRAGPRVSPAAVGSEAAFRASPCRQDTRLSLQAPRCAPPQGPQTPALGGCELHSCPLGVDVEEGKMADLKLGPLLLMEACLLPEAYGGPLRTVSDFLSQEAHFRLVEMASHHPRGLRAHELGVSETLPPFAEMSSSAKSKLI